MKLISSNSFLTAATAAAALVGAIVTATLISTTVTAGDMKHQQPVMAGAEHSQHNMENHAGMKMMAEEVIATGMVKGVLSNTAQLKVQHQPIAEWKMAAMQMKFNLAPGISVADFQEGQHIRFRLKQENMMKFTITEVLK
ncbi:copper-binding protein [Amphritea sp. HPY]|uniref:copper-binding protein n=1 Tax=Amphritea sp. HPY TaxID=3421652 RepID=UPI003D7DFBE7